jgi:hypothetical protein
VSTTDAGRLTAAGVPDIINRDGLSLQAMLDSARRLDELSCARVVANIAEAVHAAQRSGQPVGALTPAAIRVQPDGGVGFAAAPASPRYLAPEKLRGGAGDRRSDVFALGVMLWEALAHERLFDGGDDAAIGRSVAEASIRPPSELNANVPAELDAICKRALAREPADRYQSAKVMAADIDAVLGDAGYPESSEPIAAFIAALTPPPAKPMAVVAAVPLPAVEPVAATQPSMSPALQSTQPLPSIAPDANRPPTSPPVVHEAPPPSPAAQPRAATQPPIVQRAATQPPIIQPPAERSAAATQLGMAKTAPLPAIAGAPASPGPRDTLPPPFVPRQGAATAILGSPRTVDAAPPAPPMKPTASTILGSPRTADAAPPAPPMKPAASTILGSPRTGHAPPMKPAASTILGSPRPIDAPPLAPVEPAVQPAASPMKPAASAILGSPRTADAPPLAPVEPAVRPAASPMKPAPTAILGSLSGAPLAVVPAAPVPAPMKSAPTAILGSLSGMPLAAVPAAPVPPPAAEPTAPPRVPASPFAAAMPASLSSFAPEADEAPSFGPPAMPDPMARPAADPLAPSAAGPADPADAEPRLGMPPGMTVAPGSPPAPILTTDSGLDGNGDDDDDDGGDFGAERHVDPAAVVALHRTDRTTGGRDVLAGWGWTTGSIQAITDEDEVQDTARASHRRLVIAIAGALGVVAVIVIAALVFSGSKQPDADPHAAAAIPAAPPTDRAAPAAVPSPSASPAIAPAPGDPAATPPAVAAAAPPAGSGTDPAATPPTVANAAPPAGSGAEPAGAAAAAAAAPLAGSATEPAATTPPPGAPAAAAPTTGSAAEPAGASPAAEPPPTGARLAPTGARPAPAGSAATPPAGRIAEPAVAAVPPPARPRPAAEPPPAPARPTRLAAEPARKPEVKKPAPARRSTPDRIAHATSRAQPIDPYAAAPAPAPAPPKFDPAAAYRTGIQQYARGDINAALATFRTSLSSNPDYAPTWRGLGVVYDKLGNKGQARSAFQRYLKLAPDALDAEQIRERLQRLGSG